MVEYQPTVNRKEYLIEKFLDLPTKDEVKECYRKYYVATSNAAVRMTVCGVCAREVGSQDCGVTAQRLKDLPNVHRLIPATPHSSHSFFDGKLLEPAGVMLKGDEYWVHVCQQCLNSLTKAKPDLPPSLSLANNMWIGAIPTELSSLTFPEQLLIAHLYPRVYVFKLYPKQRFTSDLSTLQRAMRGTVSTFALDLDGIAAMVEGNLMPRPSAEMLALS